MKATSRPRLVNRTDVGCWDRGSPPRRERRTSGARVAERAPDEIRGSRAVRESRAVRGVVLVRIGEVIALPFVPWALPCNSPCSGDRTCVRSNTCSFFTTPWATHPAFIEQVFDFVSRGAYFSNTRAPWRRGLTSAPASTDTRPDHRRREIAIWPAPFTNSPTVSPTIRV